MANNELLTLDDQTLASIMNKRHRSAAKSFKSPPQPKFCIKESLLEDGREVFINVLSYSRIANQLSELDPVPLYGGMIIKSYSSLKNSLHQQQALQGIGNSDLPSQPQPPSQLIFAVMASPEVLKKVGRNFPDSPEQSNLIELMCEFCEAMNPGLKLSKKPQILKDRDLQGELKDIWTAVQNFREKEKSGVSDIVVYTEFGPDSAAPPLTPIVKDIDPNSIEASMKTSTSAATNNYVDSSSLSATSEISSPHCDSELTAASAATVDLHTTVVLQAAVDNSTTVVDCGESKENTDQSVEIEKLSIGDKKSKTNNGSSNENESSEKNIKVQNQKNKESQHHHFFPKFLTSSKEKEKDKDTKDKEKDKDKEKEKEKVKSSSGGCANGDEQSETTKVKTKKSLNFFRRNKNNANATGSPTHNNNSNSNANNIASE